MTASDVALVISASTAAVTAFGGLILALGVFIPTLRASRKAVATAEANTVAVKEVHTVVNQQRTDQLNYEATLKALVIKLGGEVPPDQSIARTTADRDER